MAKITSAHIGDLLHTWELDNGGKLIIRELPDGAGFVWKGRHYHNTISVELWNADGEQNVQAKIYLGIATNEK